VAVCGELVCGQKGVVNHSGGTGGTVLGTHNKNSLISRLMLYCFLLPT
jgi:hypothetical protein